MSCVWHETGPGAWSARALLSGRLLPGSELGAGGLGFLALPQGERGALLFVSPGVWVRINGQPVLGGLRLLEHRDEVLLEGGRLFFSLESAPVVVSYRVPEVGRAAVCPVCRGPVKDGSEAVQCPGCGRWFHQSSPAEGRPGKPCWTYAQTCRFCNHPTALDTASAWHPGREVARA